MSSDRRNQRKSTNFPRTEKTFFPSRFPGIPISAGRARGCGEGKADGGALIRSSASDFSSSPVSMRKEAVGLPGAGKQMRESGKENVCVWGGCRLRLRDSSRVKSNSRYSCVVSENCFNEIITYTRLGFLMRGRG